jgi:hypothetical protein
MRVAIISVPRKRAAPADYVKALARGAEASGHKAEIIDAWTGDGYRLPGYEYIIVAAEQSSFFGGRLPEALKKVLSEAGSLGGKKSAAFLKKTYPPTAKAMTNLMRVMEREGMMINWSEVILSADHAEALGKMIG